MSANSRREALRAQQAIDAARQQKRQRLFYGVAALVLVAIIATVAGVVLTERAEDREQYSRAQIKPPNLNADGSGLVVNPRTTGDVPTVTVWFDFQCPECARMSETYGGVLNQLAGASQIKLEYKVMTFLDESRRGDSSFRAARAAFCADVQGALPTYHDAVFDHQSSDGFTDEQLRVEFAQQAGLQGAELTAFQKCYDTSATAEVVRTAEGKARTGFDGSTPQISVNGRNPMVEADGRKVPWWQVLPDDVNTWQKAIESHA